MARPCMTHPCRCSSPSNVDLRAAVRLSTSSIRTQTSCKTIHAGARARDVAMAQSKQMRATVKMAAYGHWRAGSGFLIPKKWRIGPLEVLAVLLKGSQVRCTAGIWAIQDRANQVPYHGPYQEPVK